MTNSYLRSFVEDQKHTYDLAGGATEAKVRTAVRTTKATMARDETIKQALEYVEQESSWKMNKFSHVSAKVGTRS
jgi:hypothetical protein